MRAARDAPRLGGMAQAAPVQVAIEIEQTEGTIRGWLAVDGRPRSGFFGWLELLELLGRASDGRPIGYETDPMIERVRGC
jgi:hypothetical protein